MKSIYLALLSILGMAVMFDNAFASGTPSGTVVSSRSRVIYTTASGANSDTLYSNPITFTVAQNAALNITPPTRSSTTSSDNVNVDYPLSLTNSGNGPDNFNLTASSSRGWTVTLYSDANGNNVLDPAEISAGAITTTGQLKEDSVYKIMVRIVVPHDPTLNGLSDVTTVKGTSVFTSSKTANSALTTTVNTVNFSNIGAGLTVNTASPNAGQNVTYTFTVTNNGAVAATGVSFSDLLSGLTYVSSTTTEGTVTNGTPVVFTVGTIAPGATVTVTLTLNVPSGAALGTVYNNEMDVTYTAGSNIFTSSSNGQSVTVGVTRGVAINPTSTASTHEPEDSIKYYFTLKNTGNAKDVLLMSYSSSLSLTWKFYKDVNNNGIYQANDTQLAITDSVNFGDNLNVFAISVTPVVGTDQSQDITTFTVTSKGDNTKFQSSIATTTIDIAVISLTKAVAPFGSQPPGTQMTYTVNYANTGHGKAYNFVIQDHAPDSTTYVPGTITLNGSPVSDAIGFINGKWINVPVGTVAGGATGNVQFKITIN